MTSKTSISSLSASSSKLLSSSWMAFAWLLLAQGPCLLFFKFAYTLHFFNSSSTSGTLTMVLPFKTFICFCLCSFLLQIICWASLNWCLMMICSAKSYRLWESTFGISRCIRVVISFLMANSDSFELIESSSALLRRRTLKVGTDTGRDASYGVGDKLLLAAADKILWCFCRFVRTNPKWCHPAWMFFSMNAFGQALM